MSDRIVIVGGGLAAARVVRAYREAGGSAPVTMLSADTRLPYHRPPLSKGFLRGEIETEAVFVEPASAYAELDIDVRLGTEVTSVDTHAKEVTLADGAAVEYARLVLASGSLPRSLDVPGGQLAGIHGYRTLDDARAVRAAAADATHALIVGAGFIGMETAASLRFLDLEVTLIEPGERLFAALQNPELSRALEQLYRDRGIDVVLGDAVEAFHGGSGRLEHATTHAGRTVDAQLAIVGIGVQPSTGYLDEASIGMERGAVLVDERFETTVPGVFAIGDLAYFHDPVFGHRRLIQHWTNANHHGERLGRILAGEIAPYDQVAFFFTELAGIKIGLLGDLDAGHDRIISRGTLAEGLISYYLDDDHLVAALIVGQPAETQEQLERLLRDRARLEHPDTLTDPAAPIASAFTAGGRIPA